MDDELDVWVAQLFRRTAKVIHPDKQIITLKMIIKSLWQL